MTVELRQLRVSADLDPGNYVAGARQKAAADQMMAGGARTLNVALTETQTKVSQAGDPVARLSRQFVDGYGATQRFESGIRSLNTMLERNKIESTQAAAVYQGMVQKLGLVANASDITAQGYGRLGTVIDSVNTKMQRQSTLSRTALPANDNMASFRRQNLLFQANDIGVSLAGGMNPAMVLLQQGSQIAGIYGGQGGVNALLKDTAGIVGTIVTRFGPLAAMVGVGALAIQGMRDDIEDTLGRTVTFGETASAVFKVIGQDIAAFLKPVIDDISPWFKWAMEGAVDWAVWGADKIVNALVIAFKTVKFVWDQFPTVIEAAFVGGLNLIDKRLNVAVDRLNTWIDTINERLTSIMGPGSKLERIEPFSLGGPNPAADELNASADEFGQDIQREWEKTRIRDYGESVRRRAAGEIGVGISDAEGGLDPWAGLRDETPGAMKELTDAMKDADRATMESRKQFRGLADDILEAVKSADSLSDALRGIAESIMSKVLDSALDRLSELLFPTSQGQGYNAGPYGILGQLLGIGGGAANDNQIVRQPPGLGWDGLREVTRAITDAVNPSIANTGSTIDFARASASAEVPALVGSGLQPVESVAAYIRQAAVARGIDPNIALRVARSEGLGEGIWQSNYYSGGRRETSYGPYQLLRGGGLGDKFERQTGMSVSDPTGVYKQVDFALDEASRGGWSPWYGAAKVGVSKWEGLGGSRAIGFGDVASHADAASQALDTMTTQAVGATQGLGSFGTGLSQLGSSLASLPAGGGVGGGGGLFDWIGSLFGGLGGGGAAAGGGGFTSLITSARLHSGGVAGFGGSPALVDPRVFIGAPRMHSGGIAGDEVPAILRRGEPVFRSMEHARQVVGGNDNREVNLVVQVNGARGNKEIAQMVDQGVQSALSTYDYQKRQGGYATDDRRFQKLKRRV